MDIGARGVWYASDKLTPGEWSRFVGTVDRLGYGAQWYSEATGWESMALGAWLLERSGGEQGRIAVGSSIANIYARDAVTSRAGLRTLSAISGGRYVLGLGVSHVPLVEGLRGHRYGPPVATMRAYLGRMQEGIQDREAWPVVIAALGPRMLALAGEMARGAIPYNTTPEHTALARRILDEHSGGARRWLAVEQKVCLETDAERARALARSELERYLALPNYRNHWLRIGFTEADLAGGGSHRFLDAMVAWGTEGDIERRLAEHHDAGADHVCIQPVHEGGDWAAIERTLEAFAPGARAGE